MGGSTAQHNGTVAPSYDKGAESSSIGAALKGTAPKRIQEAEYAVRGQVLQLSEALRKQLKENPTSLPFKEIVPCNIGNPQAVGQKPLTYISKLAALLADPGLRDDPPPYFEKDLVERARKASKDIPSMGAYSESRGILSYRRDIADWMTERDGHNTACDDIYLSNGASAAICDIMDIILDGSNYGLMLPIPQYPLYSATITRMGSQAIGYYLVEEKGWTLDVSELERSLSAARDNGTIVRAIVIINPSNPTGTILTRKTMEQVVQFCVDKNLAILADEVYQENIYADGQKFVSFRKVVLDMNAPVEVFSFHSASKGIAGNCGFRGGMVHCQNLSQDVKDQILKLFSLSLCANTIGQGIFTASITPPKEGQESYPLYKKERDAIFDSLRRKANLVTDRLNSIKGYSCQPSCGAMYAFPAVTIPQAAQDEATSSNMKPDLWYCIELLKATGIIVVPGSGFGQKEGTFHYRLTILPSEDKFETLLDSIRTFHINLCKKYDQK